MSCNPVALTININNYLKLTKLLSVFLTEPTEASTTERMKREKVIVFILMLVVGTVRPWQMKSIYKVRKGKVERSPENTYTIFQKYKTSSSNYLFTESCAKSPCCFYSSSVLECERRCQFEQKDGAACKFFSFDSGRKLCELSYCDWTTVTDHSNPNWMTFIPIETTPYDEVNMKFRGQPPIY